MVVRRQVRQQVVVRLFAQVVRLSAKQILVLLDVIRIYSVLLAVRHLIRVEDVRNVNQIVLRYFMMVLWLVEDVQDMVMLIVVVV